MRIDSSGNVGIGTSSPSSALHVSGSGAEEIRITRTGGAGRTYSTSVGGSLEYNIRDENAGVNRLSISTAGNVGIGTSPSYPLDVVGTALFGENRTDATSKSSRIGSAHYTNSEEPLALIVGSSSTSDNIVTIGGGTSQLNASTRIRFFTAANTTTTTGSEAMRIDSSGRLLIGNTDGSYASANADNIVIGDRTSSAESGITFGSTVASSLRFADSGTTQRGLIQYVHDDTVNTDYMNFYTANTEAMRIDSSGNLLVGTTSADNGDAGFEARSDGRIFSTATSSSSFNRLSSDGAIIAFQKDTLPVGTIGVHNSDEIYIANSSNIGLRTEQTGSDRIEPCFGTGVGRDNGIDLGSSSYRFNDIFATNGTINTSDRNEKQDIAELSDAEQRVAVAAKGLLRKFRWRNAVAEKGDEARTHFGIIAQDLQAAFAAEGLDAGDYAMFISSTWTDEDTGEERNRMGVRYSELLAFIIAAI
jgi:hypothetical protein